MNEKPRLKLEISMYSETAVVKMQAQEHKYSEIIPMFYEFRPGLAENSVNEAIHKGEQAIAETTGELLRFPRVKL